VKITPSRTAVGAVVIGTVAALSMAACGPQDAPSIPTNAPAATGQPAPAPEGEPSCEASDIAEGDYLEDCYGVGPATYAPKTEPTKGKPSPTCKQGHKIVKGKCVKNTSARR
jgi:hypothetical protein